MTIHDNQNLGPGSDGLDRPFDEACRHATATNLMIRPSPSIWKKVAFGLVVSSGLLLGFEGIAHVLWGEPPPFDMVIRSSQCSLRTVGKQTTLDCSPTERQPMTMSSIPERPRVVLLGGSSLRLPWRDNVGTALQRRMPDVEVLNLAVEGMALANVARLVAESAVLSPDAVVIYAGHNEYNAMVFHGRVQGTRLWMLPVYGLMARSWIHGLLTRMPKHIHVSDGASKQGLLATDDPTALELRPRVDARLRNDLTLAATVSPAPVVLSTLLRNPDRPPTGVLTTGLPTCAGQLQHLQARVGDGLQRALRRAEQQCGEGAITWWLRGRVAAREGRLEDAEFAWKQSLALDPLPLRAPAEADEIIREVAAQTGATLVDLEAELGGFPPKNWFTDGLHLTPEGADRVAGQLQPRIRAVLER